MKKLVVNKKHKKINLTKMGKPLKTSVLSAVIGLSMYSGALPKVSVDEIKSSKTIISNECDDINSLDFGDGVDIYFFEDEISVRISGSDINFDNMKKLKKVEGIRKVEIFSNAGLGVDVSEIIKYVPEGTSIIDFNIQSYRDRPYVFTCKMADELSKLSNLEELVFDVYEGYSFEKDSVERICNVKSMCFNVFADYNCDIDFKKMSFLDNLKLNGNIYSLPIWFNMDEYNALVNNGVCVDIEFFFLENGKDKYFEISKKLDDMVLSLNVTKESSDREKLDAILVYVLEYLEYDSEVSTALRDDIIHVDLTDSFYEGGPLYPIFNKNTAVCGNYSALFEALADRLFDEPRDSYVVTNNEHAWNLVNVDGDLYYVDATWLDGDESSIKLGDTDSLEWYMQDDFNYDLEHHVAIDKPYYFDEYISRTKEKVNYSDKKIRIKIKEKIIITTLGALIGCMVAMKLAFLKNKRNYVSDGFISDSSEDIKSHKH